jgi:sugar/nucleoside kinase (ribokinase family)
MGFGVTAETLAELGIEKGMMTLVDEDRQTHILAQLEQRDRVAHRQTGGGSAANTLVALSQLGGKGFYSCKVASDETGGVFLADLLACGLDTNLQHQSREPGITGKCLVFVTPDADRSMNTFLGITAEISPTEIVPEALQASDYLYMEGYLVSSPTGRAAAIAARDLAKEAGVKTSFSLSDPAMPQFFRNELLEVIGAGLDLMFANETEAKTLAQAEDLAGAIAYFQTIAQAFVITRGAQGSLVYDGEAVHEIAAVPTNAIDTNGAGDIYAGTFLYGITHGMPGKAAAQLASHAAAKLVAQFGARLPAEELRSIL